MFVISFERQYIVATAFHNLGSDLLLATRRIDGDHRSFEVEQLQQQRNCRNFVGFRVDSDLSQRQSRFRVPGRNEV
jgi:hypothetical protein